MQIVTDQRVAKFVGERVGAIIYPPFTAMGIERDGEIIGGAVFNCFTGFDCHVTVAGTGWTKGFFVAVGEYVFGQLPCIRMTAITWQPSVAQIAERLGGVREGLLRQYFGPQTDGIVIGILKHDYRFLPADKTR